MLCFLISVMAGGAYIQFIDILVFTKFDFLYNKKNASSLQMDSYKYIPSSKNWRV